MAEGADDLEVIRRSRRYLLVAGDDFFGVWDIDAEGEDAIERFPDTDEGLGAAEARFHELRGLDRRRRWALEKILVGVAAGGALIWLVGGLLFSVQFAVRGPAPLPFEWVQALDFAGFRITFGALAVLAALVLVRLGRRAEGATTELPRLPPGRRTDVLLAVMVGGVVLWVLSGAVLQLVPQFEPPSGPGEESFFGTEFTLATELTPAYRIVQGVSSVAFQVWVMALLFLGVTWARPLLRRPPAAEAPGGE